MFSRFVLLAGVAVTLTFAHAVVAQLRKNRPSPETADAAGSREENDRLTRAVYSVADLVVPDLREINPEATPLPQKRSVDSKWAVGSKRVAKLNGDVVTADSKSLEDRVIEL